MIFLVPKSEKARLTFFGAKSYPISVNRLEEASVQLCEIED